MTQKVYLIEPPGGKKGGKKGMKVLVSTLHELSAGDKPALSRLYSTQIIADDERAFEIILKEPPLDMRWQIVAKVYVEKHKRIEYLVLDKKQATLKIEENETYVCRRNFSFPLDPSSEILTFTIEVIGTKKDMEFLDELREQARKEKNRKEAEALEEETKKEIEIERAGRKTTITLPNGETAKLAIKILEKDGWRSSENKLSKLYNREPTLQDMEKEDKIIELLPEIIKDEKIRADSARKAKNAIKNVKKAKPKRGRPRKNKTANNI